MFPPVACLHHVAFATSKPQGTTLLEGTLNGWVRFQRLGRLPYADLTSSRHRFCYIFKYMHSSLIHTAANCRITILWHSAIQFGVLSLSRCKMAVLVHDQGQQRQSRKEHMNKSEKHLKPTKKGTTLKVFSKKANKTHKGRPRYTFVQDLLGSSYQGMVATVCPIRDYDIPQINLLTWTTSLVGMLYSRNPKHMVFFWYLFWRPLDPPQDFAGFFRRPTTKTFRIQGSLEALDRLLPRLAKCVAASVGRCKKREGWRENTPPPSELWIRLRPFLGCSGCS